MTDEEFDALFPDDASIERECELRIAARQGLDEPGYPFRGLYFIGSGEFVKIGIADSVLKRFSDLNRTVPYPLTPLGWMPHAGQRASLVLVEQTLHALFVEHRHKGEWFHAHDALSLYIKAHAQPWPTR